MGRRERGHLWTAALACAFACGVAALDASAQTTEPAQAPAPAPPAPSASASAPLPELPPPPPPVTVTAAPVDNGAWDSRFAHARERLLAGDFQDAADELDDLVGHAPDAERRSSADTLRDIARSYASRGLSLVRRNDLGESNLAARSVNERTSDEIAVLYLNTLPYGIGTGTWIDEHTQPNNNAGVVMPMLLATGASAGIVALLDVGHPLRYGVPQSAVSGLYLGFEEGALLSLWNQANNDSIWSTATIADVIWLTSTAGMVGGAVLGSATGATPGRASFVGSTGFWTGAIVGMLGIAAVSDGSSDAGPLLAATIGLNAGIVGGLLTARQVSPSIARVRFLDLGGLAGGLLLGGLALAADNSYDSGRAVLVMTAFGSALGLGVAGWATRNMPADRPEDRTPTTGLVPTVVPVHGGATVGVGATL